MPRTRDAAGQYDYDRMTLVCLCGHTLGEHFATSRACSVGEISEPDPRGPQCNAAGVCQCKRFVKAK